MKIPKHRIKLNRNEQYTLYLLLVRMQRAYAACKSNRHKSLLNEHLILFAAMLLEMLVKDKKTLTLDNAQTLAYMQIWEECPIPGDEYTANLVRRLIAEIDQKSKSAAAIAAITNEIKTIGHDLYT